MANSLAWHVSLAYSRHHLYVGAKLAHKSKQSTVQSRARRLSTIHMYKLETSCFSPNVQEDLGFRLWKIINFGESVTSSCSKSISGMQRTTGLVVLKFKVWHVSNVFRVRVWPLSCPCRDPSTKAIAKQALAAVLTQTTS